MKKINWPNTKGTTFIELLLYIAIFLVLTPILLSVAVSSLNNNRQYNTERQVNSDSQFTAERLYDLIVEAKRIDVADSRLNEQDGRLSLIMQDDSSVVIELNDETKEIEITENGITAKLTSSENSFDQLYFERIEDDLNDPEIFLGVNIRMQSAGREISSIEQDYVLSANLERGDFDEDGCPDSQDKFPRHAECCGDADVDGICDELDNCILAYNPFQDDYDADTIGDACDASAFIDGGGGGGAFNCSPDQQLLDLIYQEPPLPSSTLKQIMLSSSPLPPTVLQALIDEHPVLTSNHFKSVFVANVKLPDGMRNQVSNMSNLSFFSKLIILLADAIAEFIPWLGWDNNEYTTYEITFDSDAGEGEDWTNRITYQNADQKLCAQPDDQKTDIFVIDVLDGTDSLDVTTTTDGLTTSSTISVTDPYVEDGNGFSIELNEKTISSYAILVSSTNCSEELESIEFDFGSGADILKPANVDPDYAASRYTSYCQGGCANECGDAGTGIITTHVYTDRCYRWNDIFPEWCSHWFTFEDDDGDNPAFIGGTQIGPEELYWEKTFKSILTQLQLENLESMTIAGEVAYQNLTQFFCDTLENSCPINGSLIDEQEVELYNYQTDEWVVIGEMGLDGTSSDQQAFEILYDGADLLDFVSPGSEKKIKTRIQFHWDGVAPGGSTSAPAFMLIDYLTVHLKW